MGTVQSPCYLTPNCHFAFCCELIFVLSCQCVSCSELDTSLQMVLLLLFVGLFTSRGFIGFRPVLISLPEISAQRKKYKIILVILGTDYLSLYIRPHRGTIRRRQQFIIIIFHIWLEQVWFSTFPPGIFLFHPEGKFPWCFAFYGDKNPSSFYFVDWPPGFWFPGCILLLLFTYLVYLAHTLWRLGS